MNNLKLGVIKNSFSDAPDSAIVFFFPECNLHCPYCYNSEIVNSESVNNGKTIDEAIEIIKNNKSINCNGKSFLMDKYIIASGGECTLHIKEVKLLEQAAHDSGALFGIYTNGLLKNNLINLNLDFVSIDIKTGDYYKLINGPNNYLDKVIDTIKYCINRKIQVQVQTVIVKPLINKEQLEKICNKLNSIGEKIDWNLNQFTDMKGQAVFNNPDYNIKENGVSESEIKKMILGLNNRNLNIKIGPCKY